ncbi:DUF4838 domain-containing protein [Puteibacter caeruleilacunae]|nr:DUF4838 domain-containing protein [Puteibacter caeruleilacunae]
MMENRKLLVLLVLLLIGSVTMAEKYQSLSTSRIKTIVVDTKDQTALFAAEELASYWKQMTDQSLEIKKGKVKRNGNHSIQLQLLKKSAGIKWDGYRLKVDENGITISATMGRGLLYGVYDFLERQGCAFFYPDPAQEIVPEIKQVNLCNELINPRVEWRGIALYGVRDDQIEITGRVIDWMAKQRYNYVLLSQDRPAGAAGLAQEVFFTGKTEKVLLPELLKRDFIINMGEHNTHCYLDKDKLFKEHPEWFAEINGKRTKGQICYSNKAAMKYYSAKLIEWLEDKPWVDIVGTWPLDGGGYCSCKECQDPETVVNAINTLAEDIKKVHPEKIVEYLSYKDATFVVPQKPLSSNVNILYCPDLGVRTQLEKDWIKAAAHAEGVCKFEYYMADHWRARGMVWLRPDDAIEKANYLAVNGFRGAASLYLGLQTWWRGSFNYYFFGRTLWDDKVDTKSLLKNYCDIYYGNYADKVYSIFEKILYYVQEGGYFDTTSRDRKSVIERCKKLQQRSGEVYKEVEMLRNGISDEIINKRVQHIAFYLENMILQSTYVVNSTDENFKELISFAKLHTEQQDGASIQDQYLNWRMGWMPKNIATKKDKPMAEFHLRTSSENIFKFHVGQYVKGSGKWKITIDAGLQKCKLITADLLEDGRVVGKSVIGYDNALISLSNFFDMGKYEVRIKVLGPEGAKLKVFMKKEK